MKIKRLVMLLMLFATAALLLAGCGGGGSEVNPPEKPNPGDVGPGGDPPDQTPIGIPEGQFTIPNGFGDLRGVAASQEYVYIADTTTLYAFDKNGNFVNAAAAPATIQAIAVFPPKADLDFTNDRNYFLSGFPVILHDPVEALGYVRIYGPDLDTFTTVEDQTHPDIVRYIQLPFAQVRPPMPPPFLPQCTAVYDMTVDRFGSILVTADLELDGLAPVPDLTRGIQVFNDFSGFAIEEGGTATYEDPDLGTVTYGVPMFENTYGDATGELGLLAVDTFFPLNRTETTYTYYSGHENLLRDFVGVTSITLNPFSTTPSYSCGQLINNGFGYNRVIGESGGNAPGSFNKNPPLNPDGGLEDPDLSNGGPSGMSTDPLTDDVYICDPGNRRVQVFEQGTGQWLRQIGDGTRGNNGSSFVAPSSVTLDYEGNIYICDVNQLRIIRESYPDRAYGGVGGRVRRIDTMGSLEGATVTLGNELGTLAVRTTNINGDYLIRNIVTGQYYMTANKFLYGSDTATIQVLPDTVVAVSFNLEPSTPATYGAYSGAVIDAATNLYLPQVVVSIIGTSLTATTDDIGRFVLNNVPPGTYQVVFTLDGYETLTRDVVILAGSTTHDSLLQMQPTS